MILLYVQSEAVYWRVEMHNQPIWIEIYRLIHLKTEDYSFSSCAHK